MDASLAALIDHAMAKGAEAAEAYCLEKESSSVDIREGRVDTLSRGHSWGIGLRVLEGQRSGFSFTSHADRKEWLDLAERALAAARSSHPDPCLALPEPPSLPYPAVEGHDEGLKEMTLSERIDFARRMEEAARGYDRRVCKVRHCLYQDADYSVCIESSRNLRASGRGTYCSCSIELVAEEAGSSEVGWDMESSAFFADLKGEEVGRRAADLAVRMLGARGLPSSQVDIILSPPAAAEFLDVVGSALMGDAVLKGKSLFARQEGNRIAAERLSLVDDGLLARSSQTFPFDDEGIPTQRTPLIAGGILQGFLYDSHWGTKAGKPSTGSAHRSSFQSPPQIMARNLYALPGTRGQEEMLQDLSRGALIFSMMGMHTANPVSGDFSVGAEGLWIERGKVLHPFRGVVIAGNIRDFLLSVEEVGSDLRFFGSHGSPSLRVAGIHLAGAS